MAERAFWNPMTNIGAFREHGITIVRGEGSTVWDDAGNALIDISGALWYCNIGYGREELAEAAAAQMRELASYKTYDGFTSPKTEELASRVAGLVPLDGAKVFFTSGGGESIDTAAKLSRAYWAALGKPDKHVVDLAPVRLPRLERVRHVTGRDGGARRVYGRLVPEVEQVPWDDAEALAAAIDRAGADRVAAFFAEPIIGAGGVMIPPDGYLDRVQEICREREVLLRARRGDHGLRPHRRVVRDRAVRALARPDHGREGDHLRLHPARRRDRLGPGCRALLGGGDDERLPPRLHVLRPRDRLRGRPREPRRDRARGSRRRGSSELEPVLADALRPLADHPAVADVRTGVGLLGAVELAEPSKLQAVIDAAYERGVLVRGIRGVALQVSPPFVITEDELATTAGVFGEALDAAA